MKNKIEHILITLLGCIPMVFWSYRNLRADLWYDEVFSLKHFTLVNINTTLFYYPAPNNHIFYNLLMQMVSRVTGLRDILLVEEYAFVFRMMQLGLSLLCGVYVLKILRHIFKLRNIALTWVVLFTTVPFMNFSLQLRGYCLSTLLLLMLLYYAWRYIKFQKKRYVVLLGVLSMMLLYTIPSNLYVLLGLCMAIAMGSLVALQKKDSAIFRNSVWVIVAIAVGSLLAVLLYLPIWEELVYNKFSNRSAPGYFLSFKILWRTLPQFFSERYALLLLFLPGLYYLYKEKNFDKKVQYITILVLFLGAFVASFLHQKAPYARVFVPLAPMFVLVLLVPLLTMLTNVPKRLGVAIKFLVCIYCIGIFFNEVYKSDKRIAENLIEDNIVSQHLYDNYYLAEFFKQDETTTQLASIQDKEPIVTFKLRDQPSLELYLEKQNLAATKIEAIEQLKPFIEQHRSLFLLTSHTNTVLDFLKKIEGIQANVITEETRFTTIIRVNAID
ncbi:hypothetical protein [Marinirhabdus gelatinilytica]|uniref:Dolichyl-phosphate-mannose-protein mannosyltransferase n=1 Tax=Marinirhabdus gelatinilytica TaxID=1703343 RepID=A0A370Q4F6_9FLAO|nr:hypothetical protein [Marinirhabdus gelatinilytica]RDK83243.1 hypothetical protein C8D94_10831 [Marinirhabdus gelatinilytica]